MLTYFNHTYSYLLYLLYIDLQKGSHLKLSVYWSVTPVAYWSVTLDKFSHLEFYSDIGNIVNKIRSKVTYDYISHTVKELVELRDHVSECSIVSPKLYK